MCSCWKCWFFFIVKICILFGLFRFFTKIFEWAANCVNIETISSMTESTPSKFSRLLSQRSNLDSFSMDIWPNAHPARNDFYRCLSQCGIDFITYWVNTETILSLTESTRKLFYSWSSHNREIFQKRTSHDRLWEHPARQSELRVTHLGAVYSHPVILSS